MRRSPFLLGCVLLLLLAPTLAAAHAGGHTMGTLTAFDQDHLEIKGQDGKVHSVKVGKDTKYFRGSQEASAANLVVGLRVTVHFAADKSAAEVHLPRAPLGQGSAAPQERRGEGTEKTLTGVISDTMCGATHMMKNASAADCARACVKQGSHYALVVGTEVYTLAGHDAELDKYAGQKVTVKGTLSGKTVTLDSVAPLEKGT